MPAFCGFLFDYAMRGKRPAPDGEDQSVEAVPKLAAEMSR
jgi:hypothetical protein